MKTTTGQIDTSNIKRCYIDGAKIEIECPRCHVTLEEDFDDRYLSYPDIGETISIGFYCESCEDGGEKEFEYKLPIYIVNAAITIEYDQDELEKE